MSEHRSAKKILRFRQPHWQSEFLEQAEQFEHDYDNDDYSDYVEDVSVHAGTGIRIDALWPAFLSQTERRGGLSECKTAQFALKPRFSYAGRQGDK